MVIESVCARERVCLCVYVMFWLTPSSLQYGLDTVMNAIHVTDLSEDGQLECDYIFRILDGN